MGKANNLIIAPFLWNGEQKGLPIMVFEHSAGAQTSLGKGLAHDTIWGAGHEDSTMKLGPGGYYCVEFRFPHPKKAEFFLEFIKLNSTYKVESPNDGGPPLPLHVTYGKLAADQRPLLTKDSIATMLDNGALGAAATAADGAALVAVAAGASAAGGPITLGVTLVVVGIIIAGAAVKTHIENKKAKQVFVRISNDSITTRKIWSYEEKIYQSTFFGSGSMTFQDIAQTLRNWA